MSAVGQLRALEEALSALVTCKHETCAGSQGDFCIRCGALVLEGGEWSIAPLVDDVVLAAKGLAIAYAIRAVSSPRPMGVRICDHPERKRIAARHPEAREEVASVDRRPPPALTLNGEPLRRDDGFPTRHLQWCTCCGTIFGDHGAVMQPTALALIAGNVGKSQVRRLTSEERIALSEVRPTDGAVSDATFDTCRAMGWGYWGADGYWYVTPKGSRALELDDLAITST